MVVAFRDWLIEEGGQSQAAQDAIAGPAGRPVRRCHVAAAVRGDNRVLLIDADKKMSWRRHRGRRDMALTPAAE